MKRLKIFFLIALALLLFSSLTTNAQTKFGHEKFDDAALLLDFPSTKVDSTATVYSEVFTLAGFDYNAFTSYPVYYSRILTSVKGKPRILNVIQGTFTPLTSSSWEPVDTVSVNADSTETRAPGTLNFNSKKYPYYRNKITGTAGNRSDTYVKFEYYLPYPFKKN